MADKEKLTVGAIVWQVAMAIIAIAMVAWLLRLYVL
jgi:hypothetical protein